MKKIYLKPAIQEVMLQQQTALLINSITGLQNSGLGANDEFIWGDGGHDEARSPGLYNPYTIPHPLSKDGER